MVVIGASVADDGRYRSSSAGASSIASCKVRLTDVSMGQCVLVVDIV